jgi:aryl-alcohol dehydrogenase-like predicted oxidoreductase
MMIATKVGHRNMNDAITLDYSKKYILEACDASLKRLRRETIDYYQLHSARLTHLENGECIEAMQALKQEGKIRYWGLSLNTFYPEPEAEFLMKNDLADGFQLVFNIINQRAYNLINKAGEKGYGIIARMPLQFGLLTGKFSSSTAFSADDHRSVRLTPEVLKQTLSFLENKVSVIAKEEQLNETQLALSFILSNNYVSTVIPGIRTPEHVGKNTSGLKKLSQENMDYLLSLAGKDLKPIMEVIEKAG